jgi:hypothetical protein
MGGETGEDNESARPDELEREARAARKRAERKAQKHAARRERAKQRAQKRAARRR